MLALGALLGRAQAADPAALEFFERKVRPALAEHCYPCHGAEKQKAALRLDHISAILKGGDNGPALVAGDADASRIVKAIRYGDVNLQMPPAGKLPDAVIADITTWIAQGAAWPDEPAPAAAAKPIFDLAGRRAKHWAWQPLQKTPPPAVQNATWPRSDIDRYVLAKLEAAGLSPAPEAKAATLQRRLTYDLTGLPPTPEEQTEFALDTSPDAYEHLVDRLLASPHFGERWARHWLDLTRYAETYGFEQDFGIKEAWRYRDYVVRAFNADVPYDQLVREHLAGDLLPEPRRNADDGSNESILATGCWPMYQAQHAPVDVRMDHADRIDNQIDVFSKTFLGLTVSCARCHDHKFDAISTADYYALTGIFRSARQQYAELDPHGVLATATAQLGLLHARGDHALGEIVRARLIRQIEAPEIRLTSDVHALPASLPPGEEVFADFNESYAGWYATGTAFGDGPTRAGAWMADEGVPQLVPRGVAHSGLLGAKLRGALRSPTFTLAHGRIHFLAAGDNARIRLVIEGYMMRDVVPLLFESTQMEVDHGEEYRWLEMAGLEKYKGCEAYLELLDEGKGFLTVDTIAFSDGPAPETPAAGTVPVDETLSAWLDGSAAAPALAKVNEALRAHELPLATDTAALDALMTAIARADEAVPEPVRALAWAEGNGVDERVFVRGNPRNLGELAPRRFLEALEGPGQAPLGPGSGRLELADRLLGENDPLLPRVLVNRVWQHLFGRGIVPTVDNFGALGQPPTHPELLDYLATDFREEGWSIKRLIKRIVMSAAYRMSSEPADAHAEEADPANLLLHRMPLRRLQAEAVRDAVLAVSGTLRDAQGGPSVAAYISPFMGGFRKPETSGPMDGDHRRTIYLEVRRNFLPTMLQAFDFPAPDTTHGARNVSNVPAQSLVLMNDPFVAEQAKAWANTLLSYAAMSPEQKITVMYRRAFARLPQAEETTQAITFLRAQAAAYGISEDRTFEDPRPWADLCHTLFMLKEFIYIG